MLNVEPSEGSSEEDTVTSKQKPGFGLASLSTLAHPGKIKEMASSSIFRSVCMSMKYGKCGNNFSITYSARFTRKMQGNT